ncbi:hypothetical protein DPMN_156259 [Dreissena polymorpha]|uniref:Centrosomal protein POC5 n=1 Tax=Dreissena polymorpha TaxID=45954 RepID=A0A9D4J7E3_DREPO|nr:hypothetical protein DPMN_156259 [Dreissena polymorpha]
MVWQRPTRLIIGPCIHVVEIDRIVIRYVQYQFEVNRCRNEEFIGGPGLVMGPCIVAIDRIVIRDAQYQFEVNRCRNEEVIVKGNFGWAWSMWAGAPQVEIDRIVIRDVQYQFEVNQCRNEEVIVKGNFGWAWSIWAGRPRVGNGAMHNVQYQFEVNRCRNEEVNFQGSSAYRRTAEITTISPRFSKSVGIKSPDIYGRQYHVTVQQSCSSYAVSVSLTICDFRNTTMSFMSSASDLSAPDVPPLSPGSSVSTRLQDEYDELLKFAVVVPKYDPRQLPATLTDTRESFLQSSQHSMPRRQPVSQSWRREDDEVSDATDVTPINTDRSPRAEPLPDFGGQSPIGAQGPPADPDRSEDRPHDPIPSHYLSSRHTSRSSVVENRERFTEVQGEYERVYTATVDPDVGKMETVMDQWCLDLKRNILAEFSQSKIRIVEQGRQQLVREQER